MNIEQIQLKYNRLRYYLENLGSIAIAFSGGVDSTFLLKVAHDILGDKVLAVTARSCSFPKRELDEATEFARSHRIEHAIIDSEELEIEGFSKNPVNRCYLCKSELFGKIRSLAEHRGIRYIAEGSNADDEGDYRPGLRAVEEFEILSPLRQVALGKNEIRQLSKEIGLPTWNKQGFACLASRFPYGEEITPERLKMVDLAEQYLLDNGFRLVRVRIHGNLARIETDENGFELLIDKQRRQRIYKRFQEIGFDYVAVDILGYRTGSMNEPLQFIGSNHQSNSNR